MIKFPATPCEPTEIPLAGGVTVHVHHELRVDPTAAGV